MKQLVATIVGFTLITSIGAQADPYFEIAIRRFEVADLKKAPAKGGIVFVGSSSIVLWRTLSKDFPTKNVINRGFGGSQIIDSVRNAHRIVTPYDPKMVVFFAGTNDIASGRSAETVLAHYKAFVGKVREKSPDAKIAFIAITPAPSRWSMIKAIRRANDLIASYIQAQPNQQFINTFPEFLNSQGGPRPELFVEDQLHMNEKGYEIWKRMVGPVLP